MKILIFEGIATSGKSTIILGLSSRLATSTKTVVYEEADTHIPIMRQTDELHLDFFEDLINKAIDQNVDVIIFDRLYLTQVFRAKASVKDYSNIEDMLLEYPVTSIFLKVDEEAISDRITKSLNHRDSEWADYLSEKGKTPEDISKYYIGQQRNQLELLKQSKLPFRIFDTTDHNYKKVEDVIISEVLQIKS